ncbi:MAG: hypothetical protein ACREHD_22755, partial [Pirellulales bacterium]
MPVARHREVLRTFGVELRFFEETRGTSVVGVARLRENAAFLEFQAGGTPAPQRPDAMLRTFGVELRVFEGRRGFLRPEGRRDGTSSEPLRAQTALTPALSRRERE